MRNDCAILSRTYVHANIPVKQKALYMNWTKLWSVLQITYIHNNFCSRYDTVQCTEKGKGGGGKGVRWVWLWWKYPTFKFHSEVRSIFLGNIAPTPREAFIIGTYLQLLKCRNLFQYPRSGVIILLALIGSNYCLTLAKYTLFQILSHVM